MNMVQVYIKGQEDKELNSFFRYYPVRIKNIGMDAFFDRQVIFDFKDGRNHTEVAKCVAKMLVKKFGRKVRDVVFSCVPASSQERNEARNKNFSELVCRFSGAIKCTDKDGNVVHEKDIAKIIKYKLCDKILEHATYNNMFENSVSYSNANSEDNLVKTIQLVCVWPVDGWHVDKGILLKHIQFEIEIAEELSEIKM